MDPRNDHDILIRVETNLSNLTDEVRLMRDGSAKRLSDVETGKLDKAAFDDFQKTVMADHEKRLRRIERYYFGALAIVGFINFCILIVAAIKK